jgi:hypothetical protein
MPSEKTSASLLSRRRFEMTISHDRASATGDLGERAEQHADEAEKLLKSWFLSSHVKGQLHATLAVYYTMKQRERAG